MREVYSWSTSRRDVTRIEFAGYRSGCRALQVESTPKAQTVHVFMEPNDETDAARQRVTVVLPDGGIVEIRGSDFYIVDVRRPDGSFVGWLETGPEDVP